METIEEYKNDNINKFLHSCGFEFEESIPQSKLSTILGDNNTFTEDYVDYDILYEYLKGNKNIDTILDTNKNVTKINNKSNTNYSFTQIAIILCSISLWLINFILIPGSTIFKCAKGFGLNLRIWSVVLSLLMCRTIISDKIYKNTDYHILIGYIYLLCAIGHTICHFIFHIGYNTIYISGYLLTFFILLIGISSYYRHLKYDLFFYIHRLNYFFLPLLILHQPNLWYWFTAGLIIVSFEHCYNLFYKTQISKLSNSRVSKYDDIIYLSFPRSFPSVSGSYYRIMIPSINSEWHPFSVSNTHLTDQLLFIVSIRGDWTNKLKEKLLIKSDDFAVIVGPFITCSCNILNNECDNNLCIAGGIGIAPYISIIDTKVQLGRINDEYRSNYLDLNKEIMEQKKSLTIQNITVSFNKKSKQKLTVVWIVKEPQHLMEYINDVINISESVNFIIYITCNADIKMKWYLITKIDNSNIRIYFNRPNLENLIDCYDNVYLCGPKRLEDDLLKICKNNLKTEKFD